VCGLLVDRDRLVRRGLLQFILRHKTQDRRHHGVFAHGGIDHRVIYRTVRPLRIEILLDKGGALAVNRIHQRLSLRLRVAVRHQLANFVSRRGIQKEA
jgi:hypothetical protein